MPDVKWIKITTDIFDDEKILLIESLPESDAIIVIWFKLLCLAGKMNNSGVFLMNNRIPITIPMLATIFRRKEATVKLALDTFCQFGMVDIVENVITIPNWGKHQTMDQLESKKEYMREYMKGYRKKQRDKISLPEGADNSSKSNRKTNSRANVSSLDKDIDIDIEKDSCSNNKYLYNTRAREEENNNDDRMSRAVNDYMNRINPEASPTSMRTLLDFERELSSEVCIRAFDIALDEKKTTWSYIHAILKDWKARGIHCVADLEESEARRSGDAPVSSRGQKKYKAVVDENGFTKYVEDTGDGQ